MTSTMTSRERWLAAIKMQPVDRMPFWPKILSNYAEEQAAPFKTMTLDEIHEWIGTDVHKYMKGCVKTIRKDSSRERHSVSESEAYTIFRVGKKELRLEHQFDPYSSSWHPVEHPIKDLDSLRVMTEFFLDAESVLDEEALAESREIVKAAGPEQLTASCAGTSPLMDFVQTLAGVENTHYLIADHPDAVDELFDAMHRLVVQSTRIMAEHSPVDVIFFNENTSTTLISPEQFERYSYRHIREYAEILNQAGRLSYLHMCGHLKALLPLLSTIPVHGFEAFTSPTLGNTTLMDGRSTCADKCLIGGTNAFLWTRSAEDIIQQLERDIEDLPHHRGIVVTSAGRMPNHIDPPKIKAVCDWVKAYPAKN